MAASFSNRDRPPWNTATSCPASMSRCWRCSWVARNCVKMTILSLALFQSLDKTVDLCTLVLGGSTIGQLKKPRSIICGQPGLVGDLSQRARRGVAGAAHRHLKTQERHAVQSTAFFCFALGRCQMATGKFGHVLI